MAKDVAQVWEFQSSSSTKTYETLQYTDGSTSCNCPGWTRRVAADGTRTCKHIRMVDMGTADRECTGHHDYTKASGKKKVSTAPQIATSRTKVDHTEEGGRRVLWRPAGAKKTTKKKGKL